MDYWTRYGERLRANPEALRAANELADEWTTRCDREAGLEPDCETFHEAADRNRRSRRRLMRRIVRPN